jgi:uncharacterized membrane protein (UPF0127 family)
MPVRLVHTRTGDVLAERIEHARTWYSRGRGLIGRELSPGQALIIEPAAQVHTFFMRAEIDVVFCDRDWEVLHVVSPLRRRRVSRWVRRARYAIELPRGGAGGIEKGDRLQLV